MTGKELFWGILAVATIIVTLSLRKNQDTKKDGIHICEYNDSPKCYEKCCNHCEVKSECDYCCGGECSKCGGYKYKKTN